MCRSSIALTLIVFAFGSFYGEPPGEPPSVSSRVTNQELKSGPQPDETLPGSFQPLNVNGPFAGRYHSLVTEYRLNPVALVFLRAPAEGIDPEVQKLLEGLDKVAEARHLETGLETFVVFLTPQARSAATEDAKDNKGNADQAKRFVDDTVNREKLVNSLKEFSAGFKRLVVTCSPVESVAQQYGLGERAEVTAVVYARHRVYSSFAFAEGQLRSEGIDNVLKGVDAMLDRLKKGQGITN
jgi:hypothetical protein